MIARDHVEECTVPFQEPTFLYLVLESTASQSEEPCGAALIASRHIQGLFDKLLFESLQWDPTFWHLVDDPGELLPPNLWRQEFGCNNSLTFQDYRPFNGALQFPRSA